MLSLWRLHCSLSCRVVNIRGNLYKYATKNGTREFFFTYYSMNIAALARRLAMVGMITWDTVGEPTRPRPPAAAISFHAAAQRELSFRYWVSRPVLAFLDSLRASVCINVCKQVEKLSVQYWRSGVSLNVAITFRFAVCVIVFIVHNFVLWKLLYASAPFWV